MGPYWDPFGASWSHLGAPLGHLELSWGQELFRDLHPDLSVLSDIDLGSVWDLDPLWGHFQDVFDH